MRVWCFVGVVGICKHHSSQMRSPSTINHAHTHTLPWSSSSAFSGTPKPRSTLWNVAKSGNCVHASGARSETGGSEGASALSCVSGVRLGEGYTYTYIHWSVQAKERGGGIRRRVDPTLPQPLAPRSPSFM